MAKRKNLADRLITSAGQALEIAEGRAKPGTYRVHEYPQVNVGALLNDVDMKQVEFAETYGLSVNTLRGWLKGKQPDQTANAYLLAIKADPKGIAKSLKKQRAA